MEKNLKLILDAMTTLQEKKEHILIAIDGRSASGKTTLAEELKTLLKSQVIHMDDFFLRPEQISDERLSKPGENVDWERVEKEVLIPLQNGRNYFYQPYDCHTQTFKSQISGEPTAVTILEGAYSCNSHLWSYADLHVFMTISPQLQLERIIERNGKDMAEIFLKKWIPLEEFYFKASDIEKKCELHISGDLQ